MLRRILVITILSVSLIRAGSQHITEVLEYVPAPGQFTNTSAGSPSATHTICGGINGLLSLGAFGGYVVFRFEEAVENHPGNPYGVDFTIFGNPPGEWSEPGIVWVMKDSNGNGLPDDTWYQLAGSDHHFSGTVQGYRVTYTNPGGSGATDVPWTDHLGNSGVVKANSVHSQPYYPLADSFPGIPADSFTLEGTLIEAVIDTSGLPFLRSARRAFGYADNRLRGDPLSLRPDNPYTAELEHSGGDAFDIGWAVDLTGAYVELDSIHFVRVQSGVMGHGGWLGELSTEITGAVDVAPDPSLTGVTDMVVIRDLPPVITETPYPLEGFVFEMGRIATGRTIQWGTNLEGAFVDQDHLIHLTRSGDLTLTATLADNPEIRAVATTTVQLGPAASGEPAVFDGLTGIYPNPAGNTLYIRVHPEGLLAGASPEGASAGASSEDYTARASLEDSPDRTSPGPVSLLITDISGRVRLQRKDQDLSRPVNISGLSPGVYFIRIETGSGTEVFKFMKQ